MQMTMISHGSIARNGKRSKQLQTPFSGCYINQDTTIQWNALYNRKNESNVQTINIILFFLEGKWRISLLWFEYEVSSRGLMLKAWSPAGDIIWGGSGNCRRQSLAGGSGFLGAASCPIPTPLLSLSLHFLASMI